jgi:aryl-alcohol dehydrogenase (NADP+)
VRIAHAAFDGGINLIDTSDFYSFGEAEIITGKAIAGRRDKVVLTTKCGMQFSEDPNERGGSRRWIKTAVDRSLKRLNTDYIDIYMLHQPDPATEIEETVDAMNDLVRAGKIRYFGTSNFTAQMISEAQLRARLRTLLAPHSEQSSYSIFNRTAEIDLLPTCLHYDLGFFAYSPLDSGWLSGKYRRDHDYAKTPRHRLQGAKFDLKAEANERKLDAAEALIALADEAGISMPHLAIGFVLAHKGVTTTLVGSSKLEHIETHLRGQTVIVSDEVLDRIDAIVRPGTIMPHTEPSSAGLADKQLRRRKRTAQSDAGAGMFGFLNSLVEAEKK